jgi:endonuclease-3
LGMVGWAEIESLIRQYSVVQPHMEVDPFEALIRTILSQNTNDLNSYRAFESLKGRVGMTPAALASADVGTIAESIRMGGLYNLKAARIKLVSEELLVRYPRGLAFLKELGDEEVRRALSGLKGVGPKTVDIVLAFSLGRDVIPVDTHVNRVSKRMGYANPKAGYRAVKEALEAAVPPGKRLLAHFALITHGRRTCKALRPLCGSCPVRSTCSYYRLSKGRGVGGRA